MYLMSSQNNKVFLFEVFIIKTKKKSFKNYRVSKPFE